MLPSTIWILIYRDKRDKKDKNQKMPIYRQILKIRKCLFIGKYQCSAKWDKNGIKSIKTGIKIGADISACSKPLFKYDFFARDMNHNKASIAGIVPTVCCIIYFCLQIVSKSPLLDLCPDFISILIRIVCETA